MPLYNVDIVKTISWTYRVQAEDGQMAEEFALGMFSEEDEPEWTDGPVVDWIEQVPEDD